ncbi:helix-turn-helix transcriptional regulator [Streptomyces rugosispiralis]|uniref:Winged helix-turn-helix domain-containing protein n=1 Tax=Streptomyces rugosispiralis TaxID=2967341 RepID=A0ABT1V162_9ACTN|nr:helix-turn-helix domain-containing protein [Streptomyces rugosispiralis]MCQ8191118.1 winged helix-turn-helix domain-containing protein [Streptomyces rugosispiralis]
MGGVPESHSGWTFLTNHARVLAAIADDPNVRIRDIAAHCRLTERAVQKIIGDLEQDGYLSHTREGRTNTYRIEPGKVLRHPAEAGLPVASLLSLLLEDEARRKHADGPLDESPAADEAPPAQPASDSHAPRLL